MAKTLYDQYQALVAELGNAKKKKGSVSNAAEDAYGATPYSPISGGGGSASDAIKDALKKIKGQSGQGNYGYRKDAEPNPMSFNREAERLPSLYRKETTPGYTVDAWETPYFRAERTPLQQGSGNTTMRGQVSNAAEDAYGTSPEYPGFPEDSVADAIERAVEKIRKKVETPTPTPSTPDKEEEDKKQEPADPTNQKDAPDIDIGQPDYNFDYGEEPTFTFDRNAPEFTDPGQDNAAHEIYKNTMDALERAKGEKPEYSSQYDEQIKKYYEDIINRGPFKYDSATDPLYQQYVQDYTTQGRMAARDTMGQAAALTGGYGSSYAQAVGQQQYDQYLQRMADILPETYGMALNAYNAEGERLNNLLGTTRDLEQSDYARYRDRLAQYNTDVDRAQSEADKAYDRMTAADQRLYDRAQDEYNRGMDIYRFDYSRAQDDYDRAVGSYDRRYSRQQDEYERQRSEDETRYQRERDRYETERETEEDNRKRQQEAYDRLITLIDAGYTPTAEDYANAGLTPEQGAALLKDRRSKRK